MPVTEALLDSNVIIAAVASTHLHHRPSAALFDDARPPRFAVAAHSYAEAFVSLTRRGPGGPFGWPAAGTWAALQSVAAVTKLVGLTPAQTFDTVRSYSDDGNIGPRLYDRLIGQCAVQHGIKVILTWNVSHFRALFPELEVRSPG